MKIAIAQINPIIGDFNYNFNKIRTFISKAREKQAELIIFPELVLSGYPPLDFLDKNEFLEINKLFLDKVRKLSENIGIIVGSINTVIDDSGIKLFNSAFLFHRDNTISVHNKTLLPNYDVFDEARYFEKSKTQTVVDFSGTKLAVSICEDAWNDKEFWKTQHYEEDPIKNLSNQLPDLIVNISASPYTIKKDQIRTKMFSAISKKYQLPLILVGQVGANSELIFDGASKVFDSNGDLIIQCKKFEEDIEIYDTNLSYPPIEADSCSEISDIHKALILGIKDYCNKSGFNKAILGLSGGIDSAVVYCLAVQALGKENVNCIMMPSQFSSEGSITDSKELLKNLGTEGKIISINNLYEIFINSLNPHFKDLPFDLTEENIQARIRGILLMAFSNKFGYLVLTTGNKSELGVGYSTLYGDMCGGLAVIGDLYKTQVYQLAEYINSNQIIIPVDIIKKAPSAELRPNQKDQDSLPPYNILDEILFHYIEEFLEEKEIIKLGYDEKIVSKILTLVDKNEYKRRQSPPVLKISAKAFGLGRRFPIVQGWRNK